MDGGSFGRAGTPERVEESHARGLRRPRRSHQKGSKILPHIGLHSSERDGYQSSGQLPVPWSHPAMQWTSFLISPLHASRRASRQWREG